MGTSLANIVVISNIVGDMKIFTVKATADHSNGMVPRCHGAEKTLISCFSPEPVITSCYYLLVECTNSTEYITSSSLTVHHPTQTPMQTPVLTPSNTPTDTSVTESEDDDGGVPIAVVVAGIILAMVVITTLILLLIVKIVILKKKKKKYRYAC